MVRVVSLFGLAGLFLAISPPLREQVVGVLAKCAGAMAFYAPYSYAAGVLLVLVVLLTSLNRGAQVR
jgi:hypothetical protein